MKERAAIHCYISGKVQGVFFRANAKKEADLCGITGFARNLPDGRVEVVACGEKEKLLKFYDWLKHGPEDAKVTDASYEETIWESYERFEVL